MLQVQFFKKYGMVMYASYDFYMCMHDILRYI